MLQTNLAGSLAMFKSRTLRRSLWCVATILLLGATAVHAQTAQPIRAAGMELFYGVIPAAIILGHPEGHAERKMHDGVPKGGGQHHLLISIFDSKNGERIGNAAVKAKVAEVGLGGQEKTLEPMPFAGSVTYGNYFSMSAPGPYRIEIEILQPGAISPVKTGFEYSHPRR